MFILDIVSEACETVAVLRAVLFIKILLNYAFFIIPVVTIIILAFDMFRNVTSGSEDNQKKRTGKFLKRVIFLIAIFLLPTVLSIILRFVDEDNDNSYLKCLSVTSERIDVLSQTEESNCIDNYEWDPVNKICLFVGDKAILPDNFSVMERKEKLEVSSGSVRCLKGNNGFVTMKQLWKKTWNRKNRCTNPDSEHRDRNNPNRFCGWKYAYKFKPADGTT